MGAGVRGCTWRPQGVRVGPGSGGCTWAPREHACGAGVGGLHLGSRGMHVGRGQGLHLGPRGNACGAGVRGCCPGSGACMWGPGWELHTWAPVAAGSRPRHQVSADWASPPCPHRALIVSSLILWQPARRGQAKTQTGQVTCLGLHSRQQRDLPLAMVFPALHVSWPRLWDTTIPCPFNSVF